MWSMSNPITPAQSSNSPSSQSPIASPKEIVGIAANAMLGKATARPTKMFMLAASAGAFIALGFTFFTTVATGSNHLPFGVAKLLSGLVFSVGLGLVIITGADLFTSTTMNLVAKAEGMLNWPQVFAHWAVVYVGNLVGSLGVVALCYFGGLQKNANGAWGQTIVATASAKLSHTPFECFVLGIGCNLAVCLAVWLSYAGRSLTDKIVAVIGPISLFVAVGFEHSVANMYMLPYGLLLDYGHGPLTLFNALFVNLLPVTLGNILGGGVFVGIYFWYAHKHPHSTADSQPGQ